MDPSNPLDQLTNVGGSTATTSQDGIVGFLSTISEGTLTQLVIAAVLFMIVVIGSIALLGYFLYRSGTLKGSAAIVVPLSMLGLLALILAALTNSADAANIAAVAVGALAGAVATAKVVGKEKPADVEEGPDETPPARMRSPRK